MGFNTESIRNIALAGHGGTGKTTLLEQILFNGGVISKAETVDSGKTVSDFTEEEIERKISIHTTLSNITWKDKKINILDTPGSSDFVGEVVAAFRSAESAIILVDARAGVQIETIKLWRRLKQREMPRAVFLNKMDQDRADYENAMADLSEKFKVTFVPVTIPIGAGKEFKGIINLIENQAYLVHDRNNKDEPSEIPSDMQTAVEEARLTLIETAAEGDDQLMEKYFEEGTLTPDEIRYGLTAGMRDNRVVPVLCGSAEMNNGISSLLNFISIAAPSPSCIKEKAVMEQGAEDEIEVECSSEGSESLLVFRTTIDQFSGKISYVKVITGKLTPDTELINHDTDKKEKIGKIYCPEGKKLEEVKELVAGDLGAFTKMEAVGTNHTLTAADRKFHYYALKLPQPVHNLAINADSKKDEDKLNAALHKVAEEDLTFKIEFNKETKETVISGMGELHINMILDRIQDKNKLSYSIRTPQVAYRETITKPAEAEYTHKKQSGGHGQYGRVVIKVAPIDRGKYFEFENAIKGGAISKGYMPGIEKGLLEGMEQGFLAGFPIVDVKATVIDGKEHPVDSSEMSFKLAAKGALKTAMEMAKPVLLEPVMTLSVFVEEQYMGDILSDLSTKRGRVMGQESLGGGIIEIDAEVPQSEMMKYAIDLRSITSGTGSFEAEFDHYSPVTGKIASDIIAKSKELAAAHAD